jgi:type II secretory pathway pseudopilin PulG
MNNQKMKGFTLVEFIGVAILMALLTAGIYKVLGGADDDRKSSELIAQNSLFASNIVKFYAPGGDYGDTVGGTELDNDIGYNFAPDSMKGVKGNDFRTAYGTIKMTLSSAQAVPNQFVFTYKNMLTENCMADVAGMVQKAFKATIDGEAIKDLAAGLNFTKPGLIAACSAIGESGGEGVTGNAVYELELTFS